MSYRRIFGATMAGLLVVAGCNDAVKLTAPAGVTPEASVSEGNGDGPPIHILQTREVGRDVGPGGGGGNGGNTGIYYHGGPVLTAATNVASVYWAGSTIYNGGPAAGTNGAGSGDGSLIGLFLSGLGGSPYFGINTTYTDGSGTPVNNIVNYTQYWANNQYSVPSNGQSVSDAQMVAMLQYGFNNGNLSYDPSTLYAIFTAGTVNLGGGFGTQYCAYHTHGTVTIGGVARTVLYAAMPYDYAYPTACAALSGSPNNDFGADAEVNTLAHETEETTTDLLGNAWYDHRGFENADKCAWNFGATYTTANGSTANMQIGGRDFLVQQNWVNSGRGGCALHL
jgi:hypothetical protein